MGGGGRGGETRQVGVWGSKKDGRKKESETLALFFLFAFTLFSFCFVPLSSPIHLTMVSRPSLESSPFLFEGM